MVYSKSSSCSYLVDIKNHLLLTHTYFNEIADNPQNESANYLSDELLSIIANEVRRLNQQISLIKEQECKLKYQQDRISASLSGEQSNNY